MRRMDGVRCMVMRGGTSKGAYFLRDDLPADDAERDQLLMRIMGTPDARQIDGIGGAHPLTSKVAVVWRSSPQDRGAEDVDVEYLFLQVGVDQPMVTDRQNCGNLLAGVGPFAIERGLVTGSGTAASVRIHMINTDSVAIASFPLAAGMPVYAGGTAIAGVPGTAARVQLDFIDVAGGSCGALLPTGRAVDTIAGTEVTLIDNGMPVVVLRAADLDVTGYEDPAELEANQQLRSRLEDIRLQAGKLMNLGDVTALTIPKLTLVAPPHAGGSISTRTFIPHRVHDAIGVLGAVSVATAALLPDSPAHGMLEGGRHGLVVVEHPTGTFDASIDVTFAADGTPDVGRAGIVRTARKLMDGAVFAREY
jgi:4-oxalomesaconate tautomerase